MAGQTFAEKRGSHKGTDKIGSHVESRGLVMNKTLSSVAYRAMQEEENAKKAAKKAIVDAKGRRNATLRHTDAQVLDAIRRQRYAKASLNQLSEELDVDKTLLVRWCNGESRGHLLRQIESEERARSKR